MFHEIKREKIGSGVKKYIFTGAGQGGWEAVKKNLPFRGVFSHPHAAGVKKEDGRVFFHALGRGTSPPAVRVRP